MRLIATATILCASVIAQTPDQFEVASLKPSGPDSHFSSQLDRGQFLCRAHTLMMLVMSAYPDIEVQPWKLTGGPAWMNTDLWDLSAKLPAGMPVAQQPLYRKTEELLRNFLAQEFQLKVHRETKDAPVYALVVAKTGSKLRPSTASQASVKPIMNGYEFHHVRMSALAQYLYSDRTFARQAADRPVIDMTSLDGFYDFTLEWTPDSAQTTPPENAPSVYTAVEQQLGLKLQPQKLPVEFLVVDHADRPRPN